MSTHSPDSSVNAHDVRLQRRVEPILQLFGKLRRRGILITSVAVTEEMEGIEFPKGIGFDTLWLAPDLIPKPNESSFPLYCLEYYFFVQLSKCLGCNYEKVSEAYENRGGKESRSTYNVAFDSK